MALRRTFFSFHFKPDHWRAAQVRNMGMIEGNPAVSDNDWEAVKRGGDAAIKQWIDGQLSGRSCTLVLIGSGTAGRKWIKYEIEKSWNDRKGVIGVHVHNLLDKNSQQSAKGANPFDDFTMKRDNAKLSRIVRVYDPPHCMSQDVYKYIAANLSNWIEEAVQIRNNY